MNNFVDRIEADGEGQLGGIEDEGNVGVRFPREKQER